MSHDYEIKTLEKLQQWGNAMGSNLLVAPWDIGDESYTKLKIKLQIKRVPSVVLTDSHDPDIDSFLAIIDEESIIKNVDLLTEILPNIVTLVIIGKTNAAKESIKDAIRKQQKSKIRKLLGGVGVSKITLSFAGIGGEVVFK